MRADVIVRTLEPWLAKHRRPAWQPVVEEGDGPATVSKFCGVPWTGHDAPWPVCGLCKTRLPLFLQLNLGDLPDELGQRFGAGLLQLFYCTGDDCQGRGGWTPFADDLSRVRIVRPNDTRSTTTSAAPPGSDFPAKRIVGWRRITDLPTPEEHEELGLEYTYDFDARTLRLQCPDLKIDLTNPMDDCSAEEIADSAERDKLFGWPAWVQGVEYPNCPRCGRRMTHVFQVDSGDNVPFMFGDVGCGHITQCTEHKEVVAFGWACA